MLELFDRPIAFQRSFLKLGIGVHGALFLSQAVFWSKRSKDDGFFYKTRDDWEEETGLSRRQQENARTELKRLGILREEQRGTRRAIHYQVDGDRILFLLKFNPDSGSGRMVDHRYESYPSIGTKRTLPSVQNVPMSTKNYTKTTSNIICTLKIGDEDKTWEEGFEEFYRIYPTKKSKQNALKAWVKLNPSQDLFDNILQALSFQLQERQERSALGLWTPDMKHPATWLNGACWEDDVKLGNALEEEAKNANGRSITKQQQYEDLRAQLSRDISRH